MSKPEEKRTQGPQEAKDYPVLYACKPHYTILARQADEAGRQVKDTRTGEVYNIKRDSVFVRFDSAWEDVPDVATGTDGKRFKTTKKMEIGKLDFRKWWGRNKKVYKLSDDDMDEIWDGIVGSENYGRLFGTKDRLPEIASRVIRPIPQNPAMTQAVGLMNAFGAEG